jgi:hypothetical protein
VCEAIPIARLILQSKAVRADKRILDPNKKAAEKFGSFFIAKLKIWSEHYTEFLLLAPNIFKSNTIFIQKNFKL